MRVSKPRPQDKRIGMDAARTTKESPAPTSAPDPHFIDFEAEPERVCAWLADTDPLRAADRVVDLLTELSEVIGQGFADEHYAARIADHISSAAIEASEYRDNHRREVIRQRVRDRLAKAAPAGPRGEASFVEDADAILNDLIALRERVVDMVPLDGPGDLGSHFQKTIREAICKATHEASEYRSMLNDEVICRALGKPTPDIGDAEGEAVGNG